MTLHISKKQELTILEDAQGYILYVSDEEREIVGGKNDYIPRETTSYILSNAETIQFCPL